MMCYQRESAREDTGVWVGCFVLPSSGGRQTTPSIKCPLPVRYACCSPRLLLLTRALLMTSSHACKGPIPFIEGEPCGAVAKQTAITVECATPPSPQKTTDKYVFDFGQEFAGVVRLTLPAATPAGVAITLKHAEVLAHEPLAPQDGSVYMGNLFWANPVDVYISKGGSTAASREVYTPSFTYHGFRYVRIPPL